jgi:hypothetical protein
VRPTWKSAADIGILLALVLAGFGLWALHARAWGLGTRSPVLNYDTAQYAVAARELAEHGRLVTPFALPVELARHAVPPWPLAAVQPGLVLTEAAIFRLVPGIVRVGDLFVFYLLLPHQREWLTLLIPFFCYLMLGAALALVTARLLASHAPAVGPGGRRLAALAVGLAFLLDADAQHFAVGGYPELPFTLGLAGAMAALVSGRAAPRRPFLFGLLLGVTGSFRASGLWLAPVLALAAAFVAPAGRRRVALLTLLGFALPLAPWWFYKWRAFGDPGWDLSSLILWEGVQGRTWFSLFNLPEQPLVPRGMEAVGLVAAKIVRRLPGLLMAATTGPRALWAGSLLLWLATCRPPRPLAVAGGAVLAANAMALLAAAASIPWLPFLFPTRVLLEAAGMLALWGLVARAPAPWLGPRLLGALKVGVAAVAIGWGANQTLRGIEQARRTSTEHGVPSVLTLRDLGHRLRQRVPANEVVMSNLGPMLSWYSGRSVVHLAQTPADLAACRRKLEFRHVLVVFRDVEAVWPGWEDVFTRPEQATRQPEWNVVREFHWRQYDGFRVVWLELGPPEATLAGGDSRGRPARPQT